MNKDSNKNNQPVDSHVELLHYECEKALLRRRFEEPLIEEEWRKWKKQNLQKKRKKNQVAMFVFLLSAAAAAIVCIFLLYPFLKINESVVMKTIYTAKKDINTISVDEYTENGHIDKKITIYKEKQQTKLENGAILSSQVADYSNLQVGTAKTNIVTIPRGQTYKMLLNDGTEVYMNADSRLVYPTYFCGKERVVRLRGEAYFKVRPDKDRPFIVFTDKTKISVLGTEFNVRSYEDSSEHITLIRGSVKVRIPEIEKEILLTPGKDIAYADRKYEIRNVDTGLYTQWKDGYFYFDDVYLADILKELGYWYNMTIEMEEVPSLRKLKLHFVADRGETIGRIIDNLNAFNSFIIYWDRGKRKLIVRKKNNKS